MVLIWLTRRNLRREKSDADPDAAGRRVGHNSTMTYAPRAEKRTDRDAPLAQYHQPLRAEAHRQRRNARGCDG